MNTDQAFNEAEAVATIAMPFLPPRIALAVGIAVRALQVIQAANAAGVDITDAELQTLFDIDAHAKAEDLAAQAAIALASSTTLKG